MISELDAGLRIWLPTIRSGSGADIFAVRLAEALARIGHEPLLQWFDLRYELTPWVLKHVAAPASIDLVHAGSWQGFAFKRPGIPLIVTEHQYVANQAFAPYRSFPQAMYHRLLAQRWARLSYEAATAVVAVSEYLAVAMQSEVSDKMTVIHNWVDTAQFSPDADFPGRHDQRDRRRPFKLLFVGNPSRWKGADLLASIASSLGRDFEIHCIGGLRKGFAEKDMPENMKLLPRAAPAEMPSIYRSVDAALVPTRYEAFGYVAVEAMACGLPVLGFDSSGTAEVCVHGETALLAPVDDVRQLVAYARQLAADPGLYARLGVAGRKRALEFFDERRSVEAYLGIYRKALSARSGSSRGIHE